MGVFGACTSCGSLNYCGVPTPGCRVCRGTGRVDGGDVEGVDPLVVLRAAIMGLSAGIDPARLLEAGVLGKPGTGTLCRPPDDRMAIGRAAGQLLRDLGLRESKARKVLTPEERAERKRERAAQKERDRLMNERIEKRAEQRERERRERKIALRAAQAIAEQHPEELAVEREAQEVFVALEEGIPDPSYVMRRAR